MFGSKAAAIKVAEKSNDTVTEGNANIKFSYNEAGNVSITVNGSELTSKKTAANESVSAEIPLADGRK